MKESLRNFSVNRLVMDLAPSFQLFDHLICFLLELQLGSNGKGVFISTYPVIS